MLVPAPVELHVAEDTCATPDSTVGEAAWQLAKPPGEFPGAAGLTGPAGGGSVLLALSTGTGLVKALGG